MNGSEEIIKILLDTADVQRQSQDVARAITDIGKTATREGNNIDGALKKAGAALAAYFSTQQLAAFAKSIIDVRGKIESLEISFRTLLGSEQKAAELFGQIRKFAVNTPMQLDDLASAAQTMIGFGIETEKVMTYLQQLGDISMGDAQKFQSLTLAFSQVTSAGKLQGQDLMQLINAGFNPLNEMAKQTGKSMSELKDDMSKGKISAQMLADSMANVTKEGGMFYGMLEKQSKGIQGSLSNLQGAWDDMLNEMGEASQDAFMDVINGVTDAVKSYKQYLAVLGGVIAAYGSYKAVLMATYALESAGNLQRTIKYVTLLTSRVGLLTAAQRTFNVACATNPYILLASAIIGVATAVYGLAKANETAEKSQKSLNDVIEEAAANEEKKNKTAEQNLKIATDETATSLQRVLALQKLQKEYPKIFSQYDIETIKLANILELTKQINEEHEKGTGYKLQGQLNKARAEWIAATEKYEKALSTYEKTKKYKYGYKEQDIAKARVDAAQQELEIKRKAYFEQEKTLKQQQKASEGTTDNTPTTNYGEDYKKAADAWKKAKEAKALIEKNRSSYTTKQYEDAVQAEKDAKEAYEKLGGDTKGKTAKDAKKAAEEKAQMAKDVADYERDLKKQAAEKERAIIDAENKLAQARVDAIADEGERAREQQKLDFKLELDQIQREKEDKLQAKKDLAKANFDSNPQNKKSNKIFDDSSITLDKSETKYYDDWEKEILKKQANIVEAAKQAREKTMNEYLSQYGSYTQQMQAITALYGEQIKKAQSEGEKASLARQMMNDIANVQQQYRDGLEGLSTTTLQQLQAALTNLKNGNKSAFDPASLEILETRIASITDELEERNPFTALKTAAEQVKTAETEVADAIQNLATKQAETLKAKNNVSLAEKNGGVITDSGEIISLAQAREKLAAAERAEASAEQQLTLAQEKENKARAKLSRAQKGATSIIKNLLSALDDVGNAVDGINKDVIDIISQIGNTVLSAVEAIEATSAGATAAIKAVESASVILAIIGAALSIATKIFNLVNDDKNKSIEASIKSYRTQLKGLQYQYEDLERQVDKTFSKNKIVNVEKEIANLQKQIELVNKEAIAEQQKKKPDESAIEGYMDEIHDLKEQIKDLKEEAENAIFGEDITSAIEKFADAYAEAWSNGESKVKSAKQTVKDMMRSMVTESIKAAIQASGAMENIRTQLKEFYADNVLTGWEQQYVYKLAENLQNEIDDQFAWADTLMKDTKEQSSTAGGFATASQDSVDELNGRFTAVQMSASSIDGKLTEVLNSKVQLNESIVAIRLQTEQSVNLGKQAVDYLGSIEKHTRELYTMNERLDQIERNTRAL